MTKYDVVVAGGGPAGCRTAALTAAAGCRTLVVEEHRKIGEPLRCAGLVSPRTIRAAGVSRDIVLNEIRGAYVHSPGGEILTIRGKKPYALVIDRGRFDYLLAEQARAAGAELLTGTRLEVNSLFTEKVRVLLHSSTRTSCTDARLLIGADGVKSPIAALAGIGKPAELIRMHAAEVELRCAETDMVHIFLGRDVAPGWFGWLIPVSAGRARAGIGISGKGSYPGHYFNKMTADHPDIFAGMRVLCHTGGAVPIGAPPKIYGDKVMVVGDAACQTKPISGGGIYLGLLGAEFCAAVAAKVLAREYFTPYHLSEYQRLWKNKMAAEIKNALRHREIFLTMTDREMDRLIAFLQNPFWQNAIAKYSDIDYPSRLSGRLSFAVPWAEKFVVAGFRRLMSIAAPGEQ